MNLVTSIRTFLKEGKPGYDWIMDSYEGNVPFSEL
jgi:hypothetical protein